MAYGQNATNYDPLNPLRLDKTNHFFINKQNISFSLF